MSKQFLNNSLSNNLNSIQPEIQPEILSLAAPAKNLYNESLREELLELQSDTDLLFKQLQSLSRQRLTEVGSVK
jgi:hypothetical protein